MHDEEHMLLSENPAGVAQTMQYEEEYLLPLAFAPPKLESAQPKLLPSPALHPTPPAACNATHPQYVCITFRTKPNGHSSHSYFAVGGCNNPK